MSTWQERNDRVEAELPNARTTGERARMPCVFCADEGHRDRKHSLSVSLKNGLWHCFRCGGKGKIASLDPGDDYSDRHQDDYEEEDAPDRWAKPPEFVPLYGNRSYALKPARMYLLGKGKNTRPIPVPKSMWKKADIHASAEGRYRNRVIVPYKDLDGKWIGWISRIWFDKPPPGARELDLLKYLYPPDMKKPLLYNQRVLSIPTDDPVLVVEGAFDTFTLWDHAAATLGELTPDHIKALIKSSRPVCFVYDGDAWQKGWTHAARLRFEGQRAGHVRMEPGMDPDEVDPEWLMAKARRSLSAPL